MSKNYVNNLSESLRVGWKCFYQSVENESDLNQIVIKKLVLLHPEHFKFLSINGKNDIVQKIETIQNKRSFPAIKAIDKCQSESIWGYPCPFIGELKVQDHEFPYSLGGPTNIAHNRRILCRWHNMIKANDIHCYPWESLLNKYNFYQKENRKHWIDEQIEKIIQEFNL